MLDLVLDQEGLVTLWIRRDQHDPFVVLVVFVETPTTQLLHSLEIPVDIVSQYAEVEAGFTNLCFWYG